MIIFIMGLKSNHFEYQMTVKNSKISFTELVISVLWEHYHFPMGNSQLFNFEGSLASSLVFKDLRVTCSAFKYRNQGKWIFLKIEGFTFDTVHLCFRNCTSNFLSSIYTSGISSCYCFLFGTMGCMRFLIVLISIFSSFILWCSAVVISQANFSTLWFFHTPLISLSQKGDAGFSLLLLLLFFKGKQLWWRLFASLGDATL